jgi:hypothetical protein
MNFVNVVSSRNLNDQYEKMAVNVTKNTLISLISGFHQNEFGLNTLQKVKKQIQNYKQTYIDTTNSKLYVDSGGYSYIVGDIHPRDTYKLIECYHDYLNTEIDNFDRIFSLDIPISLKYNNVNTVKHIYDFNYKSLSLSKRCLLEHPALINKFYLIWQFKLSKQYLIWSKIIDELGLNNIISNRAIGGMVGLKKITNIKFSPFIGISYKLLSDYITAKRFDIPLRIHLLGVYVNHDRLMITILEQLFNSYLKEYNTYCHFTYDSINPMRTAQLKVKKLDIFVFENNNINTYILHKDLPDSVLKFIYHYNSYDDAKLEINNIINGIKLNNIQAFVPAVIFSTIQLDKFFEYIVKKYEIINMFSQTTNLFTIKNQFDSIVNTIKFTQPNIFTQKFITCMNENFKYIYTFHSWFKNKFNDKDELERLVYKTIENINFPFNLKG